jgi:hypothetical protein
MKKNTKINLIYQIPKDNMENNIKIDYFCAFHIKLILKLFRFFHLFNLARRFMCRNYLSAYFYAIQDGPSKMTRIASCKNPVTAYLYAKDVDKCAKDETRLASCIDVKFAYLYAKNIDRCYHVETWKAVVGTELEMHYEKNINEFREVKIP